MTMGDKTVWIIPAVELRWLWAPLGAVLYRRLGLKPVILCTTDKDAAFYRGALPDDVPADVVVLPDRYSLVRNPADLPSAEAAAKSLSAFEAETGYLFVRDMFLPDRQFARSFVFGADKVAKSKSTARATQDLVWRAGAAQIDFARDLAETHPPALMVCLTGANGMATRPLAAICRTVGAQMRNLVHTRFGFRYFWAQDERHNAPYVDAALAEQPMPSEAEVARVQAELRPTGDFEYYVARMREQRRIGKMAMQMARNVWKHTRNRLTGNRKAKIGYYMMGELGMIMNARTQAKFLTGPRCTRLADIPDGARCVFFPLQVEPEISLHALVPDYFDQLNTVARIAMNLPSDTLLLVKEHPAQIGRRGKAFYDKLQAIPNVRLMSDTEHSYPIIRRADLIVAVTSSVAHEGAVMGRKVVYLSTDGPLTTLPHVKTLPPEQGLRALADLLNDDGAWPTEADRLRYGARYYIGFERIALDMSTIGTDIFNRNRTVKPEEVERIADSLLASLPSTAEEAPAKAAGGAA